MMTLEMREKDNMKELDNLIDLVQEETERLLIEYCEENECDDLPCLSNDIDYSGGFHEMIDSSVPVYTNEITEIFYRSGVGDEIEQVFEDSFGAEAKTDKGWPNGWKAAAIYSYLEQEAWQWWNDNAQDAFDTWRTEFDANLKRNADEMAKSALTAQCT